MIDSASFSELVESAVQLNYQEYEQFLLSVNQKRAQDVPNVLSKNESDLILKIYRVFSAEKKARIQFLNDKIWDETLSEIEHQELLILNEAQEKWAAKRMMHLAALAKLRKVNYAILVQQLGLNSVSQNA